MSKLASLAAAVAKPVDDKPVPTAVVLNTKADKFEQLRAVEKTLNKQFETTNSLVILGEKVITKVPVIPTNLPSLDNEVLGCGGIPRGRIVEVYGPESSGKTTICLHIIAEEQRDTDNLCAYIDAEHALDIGYASKIGVNTKELLLSQPDSGEQALETALALIALKFFASVRLDVRRRDLIKVGEEAIGHKLNVKAVKNKVGTPLHESLVSLVYGVGFDKSYDVVDYGVKRGVIEKSGAWYSFAGERLGQGLTNAAECVTLNPELMKTIQKKIQEANDN
jgi:recombination protein RecA